MRTYRSAAFCILVLSLFIVGPTFGQGAAKAAQKSITVYKTPT